jgi:hypothetical protein
MFYIYFKDEQGIFFYNIASKSVKLNKKQYYVSWDFTSELDVHFCELIDAKTNRIIMKLPNNTPFDITANRLKKLMIFA